jgi:hypothetical protein
MARKLEEIVSGLLASTEPTCAVNAAHVKFLQSCDCLDCFGCLRSSGPLDRFEHVEGVGLACLGCPVGITGCGENEIEVRIAETGPN